jgi:CRP-like cAMP-binding protein
MSSIALAPEHPILDGVESNDSGALLARTRALRASAGDILLSEQDEAEAVYLLQSGSVRLVCHRPDGCEFVLGVLRAPAVLGATECLNGGRQMASAVALEACRFLSVPRAAVLAGMARSPRLTLNILQDVAAQLRLAHRRQRMLALDTTQERLAAVLASLMDELGVPVRDGIRIRVRLSQDDLAAMIGATRRSVARAIQPWLEAGVITKQSGRFVVRDAAVVSAVAARGSESLIHSTNPARRVPVADTGRPRARRWRPLAGARTRRPLTRVAQ